ncbi:MAG: hypothetical protein MHPSP_004527, partial [Paramarteilia canceri]
MSANQTVTKNLSSEAGANGALLQKFKRIMKLYAKPTIIVHLGSSVVWFGLIYSQS